MEINILELGLTIKLMEKALVDKSTVTSMKAIGKIIKDMVKENIFGIISCRYSLSKFRLRSSSF